MEKIKINMLSMADKVDGQGVGSAYLEQVELVKSSPKFEVLINSKEKTDIVHSHTIEPKNYLKMKFNKGVNVAYCHFLPETLDGSIKLPKLIFSIFKKYVVSFYKQADYLVVVNPIFIEDLARHGVKRENIKYIPNYVSKEQFFKIMEKHGSDKILFATDSPWSDMAKGIGWIKELALPKQVEDAILFSNAKRLLGIE